MKKATAILSAVILALLIGCQKDASVSTTHQAIPTTPVQTTDGISKTDPFPGFEIVDHNTKDVYGCVGHVHDEDGNFVGSGVLIGPSVVLTAGHVIDGTALRYFTTKDKTYTIKKTVLHPQYKTNEEIHNDIGILILKDECDECPAVLVHDCSELTPKEPLTTVGFSHQIKKISKPGTFWYYGTMEEQPEYIKFLPLKGHIWFGDSGGAVFEDGGHLAGIIASMSVVDCTIVEQSATRIDRYWTWIQDTTKHEGYPIK